MKKKDQLIVLLIQVVNYSEKLKNKLLLDIKTRLHKQFGDDVKVSFWDAEKYWKIPEDTQCFFKAYFSSDTKYPIKKLKETFEVERWWYPSPDKISEEKAIWDSFCDGGIFIDKNVVWVHIYTLPYSHPAY